MPFLAAIALTILTLLYRSPTALLSPSTAASPSATLSTSTNSYVFPRTTLPPAAQPTESWGQLIKTGDHTYRINVSDDENMGTPDEILAALNNLRVRAGVQPLRTDSKLCDYTQSRAEYFNRIKNIDSHAGFEDFLQNQDGFRKLGYQRVGENSSFGYKMSGVHLIEFVYMQSPEHNHNQLDPAWDKGCVGVSGTATNLIFATSPF